jgi:HK97 family phage prohead protease
MSNSAKKEFRFLTQELRAAGTDAKPRISGYAARFNIKTQLQPGLREVIRPGAFRNTVARQDDCYACFNHDPQLILARVRAGSLRLKEDDNGLWFDADIDPGVSYAQDLYRNIQNGTISECSFGFYAKDDNFVEDDEDEGELLRELRECQVFDVSPVVEPQYQGTSVDARSRAMFPDGLPQSVELRGKSMSAPTVDVSDRELAHMRARIEIAKRS